MTKVVLYNAISIDGFIAGPHDETPWSDEEWAAFQDFVRSCDVCLLGKRTYIIMRDGGEFVADGRYMIVTTDSSFDTGSFQKLIVRSANDLPKVNKVGIIGGGDLNGHVAELGAIDEIILDVEAQYLGSGTPLFGSHDVEMELELIETKQIGPSVIQNRYRVARRAR